MATSPMHQHRDAMTAPERLSLRVSAMINHPVAQTQRWVTIHRLETDDDRAWEAVLEAINEIEGVDMSFNADGTVTLKWQKPSDNDRVAVHEDLDVIDEPAPF